jgi:alkylated DNA repair protein (DNA oxidative demethylase)
VPAVVEVAPGAFHLPGWLDVAAQRELVSACRNWAAGPAGMRTLTMPNGRPMSVRSVCLGWDWVPYRYSRTTPDGVPVTAFPDWLGDLGRRAVQDCAMGGTETGVAPYRPDIALINFYDAAATMGLHQDKDERSLAPVVSLSLGDSCKFRLGNTETRTRPWTDVLLDSGDLFVFGGPSRLAFHGVPKILVGTGPDDIGLTAGRLNVTLRESGLHSG